MKKRNKVIAILLVVCMVCINVLGNVGPLATGSTAKAADETEATITQKQLTFDDFGIADDIYSVGNTRYTATHCNANTAFSNAVFSGTFLFAESEQGTGTRTKATRVVFGSQPGTTTAGWTGLFFEVATGGGYLQFNTSYITSDDATDKEGFLIYVDHNKQISSFIGNELKMELSFEKVDYFEDGTADDALLKVYINDQQCTLYKASDKTYHDEWYIQGAYSDADFTNDMYFQQIDENNTVKVMSCKKELRELTFSDFGMSDKSYNGNGGAYSYSLKNTRLTGKVNFSEVGAWIVYGHQAWAGLQLKNLENNKLTIGASTLADSIVGGAGFSLNAPENISIQSEFTLSITNEAWDCDGDGQLTDAKIGIWTNGVLMSSADRSYFCLVNMHDGRPLENGFYIQTKSTTLTSITREIPSYLRRLTLDDFGMANGTYTVSGAINDTNKCTIKPTTLLNTVLSLEINQTGDNSSIQYATPVTSGWYGISFTIYGEAGAQLDFLDASGNKIISSKWIESTTISPDFKFRNSTYDLDLSLERVALDADGVDNDVLFGIWFNGKLLNNQYFAFQDFRDSLGNGMGLIMSRNKGTSTMTLSDVEETDSEFDTLALSNTGATAGAYTYNGGLAGGVNWSGDLDGKIFKSNIRFNSKDSQFFYGAPNHTDWRAIKIGTAKPAYEQDSVFSVQYRNKQSTGQVGYSTKIIYGGTAGVQLTNDTYELGISTKKVDGNGDGVVDDLELGIWFDGKLYGNKYIYINSATINGTDGDTYWTPWDELKPSMAVYCPSDTGRVVLGDVTLTEDVDYCADDYAYFADSDENVIINNVSYDEGQTLTEPGVYTVQTTDGKSTYTKNVTLYVTNDATEDGIVDVRDIVALKKYAKGERTLGEAGSVAINPERAETVDVDAAYATMIAALLADENVIQAKEFSKEIISTTVATGSGTYITSLDVSKEGTSVIGISDTADANYQTEADVFEGSGLDFVLDFDTKRNIRVLQITDTQLASSSRDLTGIDNVTDFAGDLKEEVDTLVVNNQPDLILLTGDLIYGQFDDEDGTLLDAIIEMMESYKIPWAPVLGNHEQETPIGTVELCNRLTNATYCLFNRRHEVGGNGNYSIGLAYNGKLNRTIYMLDSRSCYNATSDEFSSGEANQYTGFTDEQIAWYRTTAAKVNACAGQEISSFMCFHIPPAEMHTASIANGYQPRVDSGNVKYTYDLSLTSNENGDFGAKRSGWDNNANTNMRDYIYPYLKAAGTDAVFFGHQHTNSLSINWNDIRWTFGLKTGAYDSNPSETGGTMITVKIDSTYTVEHQVITERTAD